MIDALAWLGAWLLKFLLAISPVVALGLSTWGICAPARARKKEAAQRAKAIAVSILPDILFIQVSLVRAEQVLSQHPFVELPQGQPMPLSNPHAVVASTLRHALIPVPPMIDRLAEDMWRLGDELGASAAQMVSLLHQWSALVENAAKRIEEEGTNDVHAFIQPMSGNLNALKKATEETERGVEKIHP
ncbi:MAG: hypothetical protein NTY59_16440 [Alphaproteobacteria bacterium]|nr:hypothetical protein [Alphaproteobacteria bacterium]